MLTPYPPNRLHRQHSPTARFESKQAAHQSNQEGVNFGRRSPGSGGQNCTPNNTYIQALEIDPPADRSPIDWKLVTNLPVGDFAIATEKLEWYALRWKAEVFHKVMKSGCRAEEARLETAERLAKFLALIAMVSWRIFFLTMSTRANPETAPETVLTPTEIATLDAIDAVRAKPRILRKTLPCFGHVGPLLFGCVQSFF